MLTKEDILAKAKPRMITFSVPEWGGTVFLRAITVGERDALEQFVQKKRGDIQGVRARVLRMCICDEHGAPLFAASDEEALANLDGGIMEQLVDQCMLLCGMRSPKDEDGGKA